MRWRPQRVWRSRVRAVAAAGLVLVSGCSSHLGVSSNCSAVGAITGVVVKFSSVLDAHPDQVLLVRACVEDSCKRLRVGPHHRRGELLVGAHAVRSGGPVRVDLTVTGPAGAVDFQGRTTAHPVKHQPNGPDCPPTAWSAQVVASGAHRLEQTNAPSD